MKIKMVSSGKPLTPLLVVGRQDREPDGTCRGTRVELLGWLPRTKLQKPRLLQVGDSQEALAEALKELESELSGGSLLVTLGPLPLRQYLHPAAHQAQLKLSASFEVYSDLVDEFERKYETGWRRPSEKATTTTTTTGEADPAWAQIGWPQQCHCCLTDPRPMTHLELAGLRSASGCQEEAASHDHGQCASQSGQDAADQGEEDKLEREDAIQEPPPDQSGNRANFELLDEMLKCK